MQRTEATNAMMNGEKSSKDWKPYTGPTMLTSGSAGIMQRTEATNAMMNGSKSGKDWEPYTGPTMLTSGSAGIMERETAYNSNSNGTKSGKDWEPYTGPTMLTSGSAGIMERETAYNSNSNGTKSSKDWKPYTGPTMLTSGSAGIMERSPGQQSDRLHVGADASHKVRAARHAARARSQLRNQACARKHTRRAHVLPARATCFSLLIYFFARALLFAPRAQRCTAWRARRTAALRTP
jgi:hypothetical protein